MYAVYIFVDLVIGKHNVLTLVNVREMPHYRNDHYYYDY